MTTRSIAIAVFVLAFGWTMIQPAAAQDLVYQPQNPAFGGNPQNFQWMLQSAEEQQTFDEDDPVRQRDPLARFEDQIQRRVLNQISREIVGTRIGDDGVDLTQEGQFEFGDFQIEVIEDVDGLSLRIFNALTGDESTIEVPAFPEEGDDLF